ncbi:MAG: aminotransferase class IV [Alphaproteobacteria bacterium]|nr:aminotransferase class IV [Alphaproteobacteria bacterium]
MPKLLVDGSPEGRIPADDPGLLLGMTVFDTLRTYGRVPFRLDAHVRRLGASAAIMGIPMPPPAQVRAELLDALEPDAWLRYTLTAGGHRVLQVHPVDPARIARPIAVDWLVWPEGVGPPGPVKHGNRAWWIRAAQQAGVDEVLLVRPNGELCEASLSNVIAVVDGALVTPPTDGRCLEGVTRGAMLDAAARAGLPLREGVVRRDDPIEELYVCSTLKELAPIGRIGGAPGPGAGPLGRALHQAFRALVAEACGEDPGGPLVGDR